MISYTNTPTRWENERTQIVTWDGLASGDTGEPLELVSYADRSVQVDGTFGALGSVSIEGSNDGETYYTLTDPQGAPLDITSAGLKAITEVARYVRPNVPTGDGTTNLKVTMLVRRSPR